MKPKIDYERIRATKRMTDDLYREQPEAALVTKSVSARLVENYRKTGTSQMGFLIDSDELPPVGDGTAPQPTEFMLMSLAFCQMSILTTYAVATRTHVEDIEIRVDGHRDNRGIKGTAQVRPGYYRIDMTTHITSDEPKDKLERLVALAEGRCPVFDNLTNPTLVTNTAYRGTDRLIATRRASS